MKKIYEKKKKKIQIVTKLSCFFDTFGALEFEEVRIPSKMPSLMTAG